MVGRGGGGREDVFEFLAEGWYDGRRYRCVGGGFCVGAQVGGHHCDGMEWNVWCGVVWRWVMFSYGPAMIVWVGVYIYVWAVEETCC